MKNINHLDSSVVTSEKIAIKAIFRRVFLGLFFLFLVFGTIQILRKNVEAKYQYYEGKIYGTSFHIKYYAPKDYSKDLLQAMNSVDKSMSMFNKKSCISAINSGVSMETDTLFREVFYLSERISKLTNGAFDITVAPLVNAWGFGFKKGKFPNAEMIDSLRQFVGFEHVHLKNGKVVKDDPRMMLDFSAIAKGFGVDMVARCLERHGVDNYMVEIGGEIRVHGKKHEGSKFAPWVIGIEKPLENEESLLLTIPLKNGAMATSGNYRNYYYRDGKRYAHTINPQTGYPVQHSLLSSTVLAKDCATADAFATSFMVMGMSKAIDVLKNNPQIRAFFVYEKDGKMKTWTNIKSLESKSD